MNTGVAVIGCGLIGRKRANAFGETKLVACADLDLSLAKTLATSMPGCYATVDWQEVVAREDVGIVVIATPHHMLAEITEGAINAGCHVLVEKPISVTPSEADTMISAARAAEKIRRRNMMLGAGALGVGTIALLKKKKAQKRQPLEVQLT